MATRVVYRGGVVYKMGCGIPCHIRYVRVLNLNCVRSSRQQILYTRRKVHINLGNPGMYPGCPLATTDSNMMTRHPRTRTLVYQVPGSAWYRLQH